MNDERNDKDMLITLVGWLEQQKDQATDGFNIDFADIDDRYNFPKGFTKEHLNKALEAAQYQTVILGNVSARVQRNGPTIE